MGREPALVSKWNGCRHRTISTRRTSRVGRRRGRDRALDESAGSCEHRLDAPLERRVAPPASGESFPRVGEGEKATLRIEDRHGSWPPIVLAVSEPVVPARGSIHFELRAGDHRVGGSRTPRTVRKGDSRRPGDRRPDRSSPSRWRQRSRYWVSHTRWSFSMTPISVPSPRA